MQLNKHVIMEITFTEHECDVKIIDNELEEQVIEIQRSNQIILSETTTNEEIVEIISSLNSDRRNNKNTIIFDKNDIIIGTHIQFGKGINDFITNMFQHANQSLFYTIQFQEHTYRLTCDEILALYLNEYKTLIEKKHIIRGVNINIPDKYIKSAPMFVKSMNLIDMYHVTVNDTLFKKDKRNENDYRQVNEIVLKLSAYRKFKHQIERMKSLMIASNDRSHQDLLNMDINKEYNQDKMYDVCKKLTCEERTKYKLYQLDTYYLFYMSQYFLTIDDFINLEKGVRKLCGNMEKFHYNPLPLTPSIRPFFTHLISLKIYSKKDNLFEKDNLIIKRTKIPSLYYNLTKDQCNQIEQWCQLKLGDVLFDSDCDNWSKDTSKLSSLIMNQSRLVFLIEDTDGDKFGAYINERIEHYYPWIRDPRAFVFSLQQRKTIKTMKKYDILDDKFAFLLYDKSCDLLFSIGCIDISIGVKEYPTGCNYSQHSFDYNGMKNALTDKMYFVPKRIVVISMI